MSFAIEVHGDQKRKGTDVTYASHLLAVAAIVLEFGGDEDQAIAGLLHDTMEELHRTARSWPGPSGSALDRASKRSALINTCRQPKPPWLERKQAYIAHLDDKPVESLLVSCADKLHNARATLTDLRTHGVGFWESIGWGPGPARTDGNTGRLPTPLLAASPRTRSCRCWRELRAASTRSSGIRAAGVRVSHRRT